MKQKKIHFTGIKGVGMTPLAIMAKEAGYIVTGSDIPDEFITDLPLKNAEIMVYGEFSKEHVNGVDLVIATGAHGGQDNIEVKAAKEKEIKVMMQGEAVGYFMSGEPFEKKLQGISVAGSHGKTTTTAMIATVFVNAGLDPSYTVGTSSIIPLGASGHFGRGKYFIAEADEYVIDPVHNKTAKLLLQHPKIAVITNIELDHPDIYPDIDAIREVFITFTNALPEDGVLIICGDDEENKKLLKAYKKRVITYGFGRDNDYILTRVSVSGERTFFHVESLGADLGEFNLQVSGEHNALNGLAAIITGIEVGLTVDTIKKALALFKGSKRRLEYIGQLETGAYVYDDYAHHPTEIKKTLLGLRQRYPKKNIICIFQPHTYSRTKKLFEEFSRSFSHVDVVILMNIYASLREEVDLAVSAKSLAIETAKHHKQINFLPSSSDVIEYLNTNHFRDNTVIITMGAGDVYKIASHLSFLENDKHS